MVEINEAGISPAFLLGAGRSGTKFLRNIIAVSEDVSSIPYDISYVWRYQNDDCPHDELTPDMLNDSIKKYIRKNLLHLAKKKSQNEHIKILLEKSVPNTLRPAFIHATYPDAKFIHLIRDGRAVTESALRLWQAPPERSYLLDKLKYFPWENYQYAFRYAKGIVKSKIFPDSIQHIWGPRYSGINQDVKTLPLETVCARQWRRCIEVSQKQLSEMDATNILEIHYEDLMKDSRTIEKVCEFLEIEDKDTVIKHYEDKVVRSNTDKWKNRLTKDQLATINLEIEMLNKKLGYSYDKKEIENEIYSKQNP